MLSTRTAARWAAGIALTSTLAAAGAQATTEPAMLAGDSPNTVDEWTALPLFTIGEEINSYRPVGLFDGTGAIQLDANTVRVFVNHELGAGVGYAYPLSSGTSLTGSRISYFDIDRNTLQVVDAGMAYDTIVDRGGNVVTDARQVNQGSSLTDGIDRFCAANLFEAGTYNLEDTIYFAGEETGNGVEYALDVATGVLHAVPALGRAAWESVTFVDTGNPNKVGILVGDDAQGAPLWLYVGKKDALGTGSFLDRNGLARGDLYVWVEDNGNQSPEDFHGTGETRHGVFKRLPYYNPGMAGTNGFDEYGWATEAKQDELAALAGAFRFSRPEDVATNPKDATQVALNSTGRGSAYPSDNWGTTYIIDIDFLNNTLRATFAVRIEADITILYDADDAGAGQFPDPDYGLRSADNLDWADDGYLYAQEDRSTSPGSLFGGTSGIEASIWQIDPATGILRRIAEIDRSAVPTGQSDPVPTDIGNWESSGILDVTSLFPPSDSRLLICDVQAHSLTGAPLDGLGEGGQLLFLQSNPMGGFQMAHGLRNSSSSAGTQAAASFDMQVSPNPTSAGTEIHFSTPSTGSVQVAIFDANGRQVRSLRNAEVAAGSQSVSWDGADESGRRVAPGLYFVRVQNGNQVDQAKVLIAR
ncbi:MAG: T9SS type A sorting domain-containing protein [Candidatus Eisenbacteria bacterium]|uniref:T9SS type A sorting domain-containing protein n=1 Tax=Eiseniibacteriota bacterium TaxID=2212470 RepID=A0A956RRA8_UNCEI|nr:T9SS type A sorting domain-containing protein [Candidatus Eisenbacteria bacterium]